MYPEYVTGVLILLAASCCMHLELLKLEDGYILLGRLPLRTCYRDSTMHDHMLSPPISLFFFVMLK